MGAQVTQSAAVYVAAWRTVACSHSHDGLGSGAYGQWPGAWGLWSMAYGLLDSPCWLTDVQVCVLCNISLEMLQYVLMKMTV